MALAEFLVSEPAIIGSENVIGDLLPVHRIKFAGNFSTPSIRRPSQPYTAAAFNGLSSVNLQSKTTFAAGFIEGRIRRLGAKYAISVIKNSIGESVYSPILTIRNPRAKINTLDLSKSTVNFGELYFIKISVANFGNKTAELRLINFGILDNRALFNQFDPSSCALVDSSATKIIDGTTLWSSVISPSTNLNEDLTIGEISDYILAPNEQISLVAKTATGMTDLMASITWIEQQ